MNSNFGLIEKQYDEHLGVEQTDSQWQRFDAHIKRQNASKSKKLKVLFLGRHGEGVHNVAERKYGSKKWNVSSRVFPPRINQTPTSTLGILVSARRRRGRQLGRCSSNRAGKMPGKSRTRSLGAADQDRHPVTGILLREPPEPVS